jgi:hypothetical protein
LVIPRKRCASSLWTARTTDRFIVATRTIRRAYRGREVAKGPSCGTGGCPASAWKPCGGVTTNIRCRLYRKNPATARGIPFSCRISELPWDRATP